MSLLSIESDLEALLSRNGDIVSEESLRAVARMIHNRDKKLRQMVKYVDNFFVQTVEVNNATLSMDLVETLEDFRRNVHVIYDGA